MGIPSEILNGTPGVYEFEYDGQKYRAVVSEFIDGSPIGVTVHGGGAVGGYKDTLDAQESLLGGVTLEQALKGENYNITGQNQIDIFPLEFKGYYYEGSGYHGKTTITNMVKEISTGVPNPVVYMPEGHSATSRGALDNAILFKKNGGESDITVAMLLEPALDKYVVYSDEDIAIMKNNNIIALQVRGNGMASDMYTNASNGMPMIDVDFDIYTQKGSKVTDFDVNHALVRHMMGDYNYSNIANGTFSWEDAFGGEYIEYEYNGYTYKIKVHVTSYNIPEFDNGQEISLSDLDTYMSTQVMSDEEFLNYELSNMRSKVNAAYNYVYNIQCSIDYSDTRLPAEAIPAIREIKRLNLDILNKVSNHLNTIEKSKENYSIMDRRLYENAINLIDNIDLATHAIVPEESNLEPKKEKTPPTGTRIDGPGSQSTPPADDKTGETPPASDEKEDDKPEETKPEDEKDKVISDKPEEDEPTNPGEEPQKTSTTVEEPEESPTDKGKIPSPSKKPKTEIPSKAKKSKNKNKNNNKTTTKEETPEELVTEPKTFTSEDYPYAESGNQEPSEQTVIPDEPIDVPIADTPVTEPNKVTSSKDSKILKTIGIAAGIGAGIGAVAYGVNEQIKKKEIEDGYDYSYEDDNEKSEFVESEDTSEDYSPYAKATNGGEE